MQSRGDTSACRARAADSRARVREQWSTAFLWSLRHCAIPAGRVTINAGALEHRTVHFDINCTVSARFMIDE